MMLADAIKIAAVGDVFPGDHYFSLGHGLMSRTKQQKLDNLFAEVAPALQSMDIAFCNLEGPLSTKSVQTSKVQSAAFRGIPEYSRLLKQAGFTHVNIANNHILQHGPDAFAETLQALDEQGLSIVGLSGKDEGQISRPLVSRIGNRKVCFLGYSNIKERHSSHKNCYAYFEDHAPVIAEIASLSRQVDDLIVSCHAGDEGLTYPSPAQIAMYRQFVNAGARCVLGHHSHVFQPVERHGDGVIAYSLGNFVFDLFWDINSIRSAILNLHIVHKKTDWNLTPTIFSPDYHVKRMALEDATRFIDELDINTGYMDELTHSRYQIALNLHEMHNQREKYFYFLRNILQGNTVQKLRFLSEKL